MFEPQGSAGTRNPTPSDSAADMCTCEQSIVARNLERSYAFSEGFFIKDKFEEFDQKRLEEFH